MHLKISISEVVEEKLQQGTSDSLHILQRKNSHFSNGGTMLEDMVCVHFTEAEKVQHNQNLLVQMEKGKSEFLLIHQC